MTSLRSSVGKGSILRVQFRNLAPAQNTDGFRAGVQRMVAAQQKLTTEAVKNRWVLVDDASDVVRQLLRWAGFKEWDVQDSGVRLKRPVVFNRSMFLMDAINKVASATQYIFFMDDPSPNPDSIGIPDVPHAARHRPTSSRTWRSPTRIC
jgi:hypothetical protein